MKHPHPGVGAGQYGRESNSHATSELGRGVVWGRSKWCNGINNCRYGLEWESHQTGDKSWGQVPHQWSHSLINHRDTESERESEKESERSCTPDSYNTQYKPFLLIKEEEKEGWLAYFALLAIHVISLCTTTTHKETTSLPSLWSFIQQLMWDANLIMGRFLIKCMCIVGGLLMLIHLAEIIQKFPSPPWPPTPHTSKQASNQASNLP